MTLDLLWFRDDAGMWWFRVEGKKPVCTRETIFARA